jgi:hypothetical protein
VYFKGETREDSFFACDSLSTSFYAFNPKTENFTVLDNMPRERYRHSGGAINNQIWLVGGRTVDDGLIAEVDVSYGMI